MKNFEKAGMPHLGPMTF